MKFVAGNLIEDECPRADMIFIRNVLLHNKLDAVKKILSNVKKSKSKYIMASTVPALKINKETECIWVVRRNLEIEPFNLPEPFIYVPEILPSKLKKARSKNNYMGIWHVSSIPEYEVK